jgi:hypothetical protein
MAETETCGKCGAVYEVIGYRKLPARDRDSFECDLCGETVARWNASSIPQFKLVKRPDG